MKLVLLIATMILTGVMAHAADRNAASAICKSMTFDSDRNACISEIGKYEYFDQSAINVCVSMTFDSDKAACVRKIGDKSYDTYEIENCARMTFDSDKGTCLQNAGRRIQPNPIPEPGCMDKQTLIFELQRLDRMVYDRENNRARNTIYDLITSLQRCP